MLMQISILWTIPLLHRIRNVQHQQCHCTTEPSLKFLQERVRWGLTSESPQHTSPGLPQIQRYLQVPFVSLRWSRSEQLCWFHRWGHWGLKPSPCCPLQAESPTTKSCFLCSEAPYPLQTMPHGSISPEQEAFPTSHKSPVELGTLCLLSTHVSN